MTISRNQPAYDAYERAIRAGKGHLSAMDEAIEAVTSQPEGDAPELDPSVVKELVYGEGGDHG